MKEKIITAYEKYTEESQELAISLTAREFGIDEVEVLFAIA